MSTKKLHGCCVDKGCTPDTCMEMPAGTTCAGCVHLDRCKGLFGCKPESSSCDFFPRRFVSAEKTGVGR